MRAVPAAPQPDPPSPPATSEVSASLAPDLARQVSKAMLWVAIGTVLTKLFRLGALFFVLKFISRDELGIAQTAITVFSILQSLTELGLGASVIQAKAPTRAQLESLFWLALITSLGLYVILFFGAGLLASFYDQPALEPLIRVQGLGVVLFALYFIPKALLIRELRFGRVTFADNVAGALSGVTMIVLAHAGLGIWAIIVGEIGVRAFELLAYQAMRPWFARWRLQLADIRGMISFGLYTTGSRFLYRFYSESDYLVLGKVLNQGATGLYAFAFRTVDDITKTLVGVVSQVAFPAFARLQHDRPELLRYLYGMCRGATIFIGIVCAVLFAHTGDLLAALGMQQWLDAVPLVRMFAVIGLLRSVLPILPQVLNALGHSRLVLIYSLVLAVVLPTSFLIGALSGFEGVAWAWLIAYPPASLVLVAFTARILGVPFFPFLVNIFRGLPHVVALTAGLFGLRAGLFELGASPAALAAIGISLGLGLGALWTWKREPAFVALVLKRKKKAAAKAADA